MKSKPTPVKIGMIGSNEVMQYGDSVCIVYGKQWVSVGKVAAVLANLESSRHLLVQFGQQDKPKAPESELVTKEQVLARIAQLQAKLNGGNGNAGNNRLDPLQKAA